MKPAGFRFGRSITIQIGADTKLIASGAITNQMPPEPAARAERRRAEKEARKAMDRASKRRRQIIGRNHV